MMRPVTADEAAGISELAVRSKAYWGYDAAFMAVCRVALTVEADYVRQHTVMAADVAGTLAGFYSLADRGAVSVELDMLFVAPEFIGQGYGRALWQHATATARQLGYARLYICSDPHAYPFYRRMGALHLRDVESDVQPGRMLPLLHYTL